ncbi:cytochrome P450 10-like [Elysia marginata]|uniref:Cytochrome P450 10-like n=1 Tax=Elysia marginata TaxID=1093978 RepID=A0AAV4HI63_9GAST|nr:cytochrome P450 10-like [Elysia marginata]
MVVKTLSFLRQHQTKGLFGDCILPFFCTQSLRTHSTPFASTLKEFKDIPGPGGLAQWPVVGSLFNFKPFTHFTPANLDKLIEYMVYRYGPIVRLQLSGPKVILSNPKDLEIVYQHEGRYPIRPATDLGSLYCQRNNVPGGFAEVQGEDWYALRSPANKFLLRADCAAQYLSVQDVVAQDFADLLEKSQCNPEELAGLFFRYASESNGVVCFNTRLGCLRDINTRNPETERFLNAMAQVFLQLQNSVSGKSVAHKFYRNKTYKLYEEACNTVHEISSKHLKNALNRVKQEQAKDSLSLNEFTLLNSMIKEESLTLSQIQVILSALHNAGTESTAKNMQVLFYNLARNPDKQEKLYEEIQATVEQDQPITKDALAQMPYLRACLKESFRLIKPTIFSTHRVLNEDVVIQGYRIPAGIPLVFTQVKCCSEYFSEPEKFIPERWLRSYGNRKLENPPPAFVNLPFGHGPRKCLGWRFAEQEIYLATVRVLQKLRIHIQPESENCGFKYLIFVEPVKPISFYFTKREKHNG